MKLKDKHWLLSYSPLLRQPQQRGSDTPVEQATSAAPWGTCAWFHPQSISVSGAAGDKVHSSSHNIIPCIILQVFFKWLKPRYQHNSAMKHRIGYVAASVVLARTLKQKPAWNSNAYPFKSASCHHLNNHLKSQRILLSCSLLQLTESIYKKQLQKM